MPRFYDSAVSTNDLAKAIARVLPSSHSSMSAHGTKVLISELNHSAWVYPCRCYTHRVTEVGVRLRASVFG